MTLIKSLAQLVLTTIVVFTAAGATENATSFSPEFRQDLHPFGYPTKLPRQSLADYTELAFLSDDLLLVSINNRLFVGSSELLNAASPDSTFLLFDLSQKTLLRRSELSVEKYWGSVHATHDGKFIILQGSGIRVCSENLQCEPPIPISGVGPIFVSPRGTRIMAGGNGQKGQTLLDGNSMGVLNHFAFGQAAMPGDTAVLATRGRQLYLIREGMPDELLKFPGGYLRLSAQFLRDDVFTAYESDKTLAGVGLDGRIVYRISILPGWSGTDIVPAANGSRFCIHQMAYRIWGSHLSASNEYKTRDTDIYRIFDTHTGKELYHFEWDPRPYISTHIAPAISPNGHSLAVIRSGYLEVFELP